MAAPWLAGFASHGSSHHLEVIGHEFAVWQWRIWLGIQHKLFFVSMLDKSNNKRDDGEGGKGKAKKDEGMNHVFEILTIVFQYLEFLRGEGPQEKIYKELQIIEENEFRFHEQCDPYDYVEELVENMQLYPVEDFLTGDQLMWEFNEQVIEDVQNLLTPDRANILILSKKYQEECTETETWFQTPYNFSDINPLWLEKWKNLDLNPELYFPEENKFIATDFEIKDSDSTISEVRRGINSRNSQQANKVDSTKYQLGCMTLEVAWSLLSDGYQFDFPSINPSLFTVMIKRLTLEKRLRLIRRRPRKRKNNNTKTSTSSTILEYSIALAYCTVLAFALDSPEIVHDSALGKVWYLKDTKFKTPRARFYFHIMSPLINASPESLVLCDLFLSVLEYNLKEIAYDANVALLGYSMTVAETGIVLKLDGFNHKLALLFETIIDHIANFTATSQTFEMVKPLLLRKVFIVLAEKGCCKEAVSSKDKERLRLIRSYRNSIIKPQKLVRSIRLSILQHIKWTTVNKRSVIPDVTLENLQYFVSAFKSKLFVESLIQGNITCQEAISLQEQLYSKLQFMALNSSFHPEIRVIQLPASECICRVMSFNKEDDNTIVTNYFQSGPASVEENTKMELMLMRMEEPCFDVLRTREQLGYSVFCTCRKTFGILGFSVTVQTQATKFSAEHVDCRIDAFLEQFGATLSSMTEEDFSSQVDSLIELKEHKDLSLAEEADRNWTEIRDQTYLFDRKKREVESLRKLSKEDIYQWFVSHFKGGKNYKKLSVQVVGSGQFESQTCADVGVDDDSGLGNDNDWQIRPVVVNTNGNKVTCIQSICDFKKTRPIFPVVKDGAY
ncbi:Nardilysin [Acropora cervicornis]|uniref:Nardilysin n=1 Tax=Acropora cervicornis TaxID=6130 RepID=A0AAD9R1A2_ACRCE|nr:Nardilysin [Acropora cervicornis]